MDQAPLSREYTQAPAKMHRHCDQSSRVYDIGQISDRSGKHWPSSISWIQLKGKSLGVVSWQADVLTLSISRHIQGCLERPAPDLPPTRLRIIYIMLNYQSVIPKALVSVDAVPVKVFCCVLP